MAYLNNLIYSKLLIFVTRIEQVLVKEIIASKSGKLENSLFFKKYLCLKVEYIMFNLILKYPVN